MDKHEAINIAEGFQPAVSKDQYIEAWQSLIDCGIVWELQGFFGRNAMALIRCGICSPPYGYTLGDDGRLVKVS